MLEFYPINFNKKESMANTTNDIVIQKKTDNNFIILYLNISKITDNIYLSGINGASSMNKLNEHNIKCILNCTKNELNYFENNNDMTYMRIPINDTTDQHIEQYFDSTYKFIEKCISENKNVLVHCHAGISRSATILIAYFMRKNNISYQEAYDFIKNKRSIINPNFDFVNALKNFKPDELQTR